MKTTLKSIVGKAKVNTRYHRRAVAPAIQHRAEYKFQRYTCSLNICRACPHKIDCVGQSNLDKSKGRIIERSNFESYIEENTERYKLNKELYRNRQAIVEHQFGIIKRQWGFDYTLLKTKKKVEAEFAIIFTCYNLRRSVSILGIAELIKRLKVAFCFVNVLLWMILSRLERFFQIRYNNHFFSKN